MAAASLRQFTFFDVDQVKDVHDPSSPPELLKHAPEISTMAFSSAGLVVADVHGSVHILNQSFVSVASWVVHLGGRVTHVVERNGVLVTVGEEDSVRSAIIKVWDLAKQDKRTAGPALLRSAKIQPSGKPHPVSCLALSSDLSFLAVGLADGTVLLYRHLDQSLSSTSSSLPKPRIIHENPTEPITFLGFVSSTLSDPHGHVTLTSPALHLLITTTSSTYSYPLIPKVSSPSAVLVDEIGAGLRCAAVDWKNRWVVVGRDDALYACAIAGRVGLYALEGDKLSLHAHLNYVVVVLSSMVSSTPASRQRKLATTSATPSVGTTPVSTSAPKPWQSDAPGPETARVVLVDMENKFVAYSATFPGGVRDTVSAWGHIYVIGNDGKVFRLTEKATSDKLSLLFAKNLYSLALSVAQTQGLDTTDVHRHHGDHLYSRGDYEGAMREYVQTIGGVRASHVIRKFLTAHLTPLLMTYLQELHARGLAHAEHTTLLLNAYAKAGDVARLDAFIRSEERVFRGQGPGLVSRTEVETVGTGQSKEPPFELDTAIRVCRQAGFFTHAAYLARRWGRHEDYLRVLVEDVGANDIELKFGTREGSKNDKAAEAVARARSETSGYREAVTYLREVGGAGAESGLARYGRALLDHLPEETTQLLIDLCTSEGHLPVASVVETPQVAHAKAPSYLSYLVSSRASALPPALSAGDDTTVIKPSGPAQELEDEEESGEGDPGAIAGGHLRAASAPSAGSHHAGGTTQPPRRPSPTLFFAHFVDHQVYFVRFLETVARRRWGQTLEGTISIESTHTEDDALEKRDRVSVWNTLLELYLTDGQDDKEKEKALRLLQSSHLPYDPTHALMLCSSYMYTPGLVLLWEKLGMYEDVLRFWMEKHDSEVRDSVEVEDKESRAGTSAPTQVISALRQYGPAHPHLYPLVLRFLTSTPELLSTYQADLEDILEHVEREHIMPPMSVVKVLSRNGVASVGLVKGWLMRRIAEGREEIETDEQLIASYRSETRTKLKLVEELVDMEHPRVFHVTRCSQCNGQLDLPSIHFMCHHSYHQRCLLDDDATCPQCVRQHGIVQEIRRNNERLADQHELFLSEVRENGFRALANGFGRGWLNSARGQAVG